MESKDLGYKKANILFIKGITKSDFLSAEDIFEQHVRDELCEKHEEEIFDRLPEHIHDVKDWPKCTRTWCLYHGGSFPDMPVGIVTDIREITNPKRLRKGEPATVLRYKIEGACCSLPCAFKYVEQMHPMDSQWNIVNNVKLFYKAVTGKMPVFVPEPIEKRRLVQYGGNITASQYLAMRPKPDFQ